MEQVRKGFFIQVNSTRRDWNQSVKVTIDQGDGVMPIEIYMMPHEAEGIAMGFMKAAANCYNNMDIDTCDAKVADKPIRVGDDC